MVDPHEITHDACSSAFRVAFIRRVGVGTGKVSYRELEDATGIPVRTLKSYQEGPKMPCALNEKILAAFFGPAFASELLAPAGLGGVEWIERAESVSAIGAAADLSRVVSELTERLLDGRFCHRDRAAMGPKLILLASKMEEQGKAMMDDVPG